MYKCKSWVIRSVFQCVRVSVESEKMSVVAKLSKNGAGVASSAECHIGVDSVRLDIKTIDGIYKKRGDVIYLRGDFLKSKCRLNKI